MPPIEDYSYMAANDRYTGVVSNKPLNPKMSSDWSPYAGMNMDEPMYSGSSKSVRQVLSDVSNPSSDDDTTHYSGNTRLDPVAATKQIPAVPQGQASDPPQSPVNIGGKRKSVKHSGGHSSGKIHLSTIDALAKFGENEGNNERIIKQMVNK